MYLFYALAGLTRHEVISQASGGVPRSYYICAELLLRIVGE